MIENIQIREEIIKKLEEREQFYGDVVIKSAFSQKDGNWKIVLTKIDILHKEEKKPLEERYEYKDFCLYKIVIKLKDFIKLIDEFIKNGKFAVKDLPAVTVKYQFQRNDWMKLISSGDKFFCLEWPANGYHFSPIDSSDKVAPPSSGLISQSFPLFLDGFSAVRSLTGIDLSKYHQYQGSILIFLPNFKAKIQQIKVNSKQLTLKIVCKEISKEEIVGKIYLSGELGQKVNQSDIIFEEETWSTPLNFKPEDIYLVLLDRQSGELIDERKFRTSWRDLPSDVIFEISEEEIEAVIKRGEGETIEFKENIPREPTELAETVVAFSNTNGGAILLGINDNGEITGFRSPEIEKERVINILRTHCEPPITPIIEVKYIQGKSILLLQVKEGDKKPYTVGDKGVYIRCGATDRIATRYEIDEFYRRKYETLR